MPEEQSLSSGLSQRVPMLTDDFPYILNEGSIRVPGGFQDRSANIFVPGDAAQSDFNLNIGRDDMHADETPADYVGRQIRIMKEKIPGYRLVSRNATRLGEGKEAIDGEQIDASYRSASRTVYQRQAAFSFPDGRVLIFSATGASPFSDNANAIWTRWLESFVPRHAAGSDACAPDTVPVQD